MHVNCKSAYKVLLFPDELVGWIQGVTLAIVMELCRFGSLFKVLEYARRVSWLPEEIRDGRTAPRTPEEIKLKVLPSSKSASPYLRSVVHGFC